MNWFRRWQEERRRKKLYDFLIEQFDYDEKVIFVIDGVCEDCPGPDWCDCDQGIDCD